MMVFTDPSWFAALTRRCQNEGMVEDTDAVAFEEEEEEDDDDEDDEDDDACRSGAMRCCWMSLNRNDEDAGERVGDGDGTKS